MPELCDCAEAVLCDDALVAFDSDIYACARCGHMNGDHCGPDGECSVELDHGEHLELGGEGGCA